jgi:hypothetical protein
VRGLRERHVQLHDGRDQLRAVAHLRAGQLCEHAGQHDDRSRLRAVSGQHLFFIRESVELRVFGRVRRGHRANQGGDSDGPGGMRRL